MAEVTYGYTTSTMNAVVEDARGEARKISSLLTTMDAEMRAKLVNWTSDAKAEYETAYAFCRQQADLMPRALDQASATLDQITVAYNAAEKSVAGTF